VGRQLTLSPFLVFLAAGVLDLVVGADRRVSRVPLLIVSFVVLGHLLPREETTLPG